ncbi:MAG: hypothetical protein FD144_5956, partial [Rhodospirillaceae bacterium]
MTEGDSAADEGLMAPLRFQGGLYESMNEGDFPPLADDDDMKGAEEEATLQQEAEGAGKMEGEEGGEEATQVAVPGAALENKRRDEMSLRFLNDRILLPIVKNQALREIAQRMRFEFEVGDVSLSILQVRENYPRRLPLGTIEIFHLLGDSPLQLKDAQGRIDFHASRMLYTPEQWLEVTIEMEPNPIERLKLRAVAHLRWAYDQHVWTVQTNGAPAAFALVRALLKQCKANGVVPPSYTALRLLDFADLALLADELRPLAISPAHLLRLFLTEGVGDIKVPVPDRRGGVELNLLSTYFPDQWQWQKPENRRDETKALLLGNVQLDWTEE